MTERTDTATQRKTVLFVTTADTDILTAERALNGMPDDYPHVRAFNPVALETPEAQEELMTALEDAGIVILRLLGGKQSMPQLFDQLVRDCRVRGYCRRPAGHGVPAPHLGRREAVERKP